MTKNIFLFIFLITLFSSCKENDPDTIYLSDKIRLTGEIEDEVITLHWNRPHIIDFQHYEIHTSASAEFQLSDYYIVEEVDSTFFKDYRGNPFQKGYYMVVANGYNDVSSNAIEIGSTIESLSIGLFDALIWEEENCVFLVDKVARSIYKYDYDEGLLVDSLQLSYSPEYCAIGDNGSGMELYVPGDNNRLRIYSASDFSLVETIDALSKIYSVASDENGFIFCSVARASTEGKAIRIYRRADKEFVDSFGDNRNTRLIVRKHSRSIYDIKKNPSLDDLAYYKINSQGRLLSIVEGPYTESHLRDYSIFSVSPDGEYIVSGMEDNVFNLELNYKMRIADNNDGFNDFCFSEDSKYIYGGNYKNRRISKYLLGSYADPVSIRNTIGYPQFIFKLESKLLSIESITSYSRRYYKDHKGVIIETIVLDY